MTTTRRLGIDIVGTDRTRAAFMSAQRSMAAFAQTAKLAASFFGGAAVGALLRKFTYSIVEVNKHLAPVKESFTQIDRAWQQFALNVGKAGVNEAMMRFNQTMAQVIVGLNGLSDAIGSLLAGGIEGLRQGLEAAGRAAAFLGDNIGDISNLGARAGKALGTSGLAEYFGMTSKSFNSDSIKALEAIGLNTKSLTVDLNTFNGQLKALPPTFDEIAKAAKKTKDPMEELRTIAQRLWLDTQTPLEKYKSGVRELNVLQANGVLIQDTYARRLAQLKEEFTGASKTVKDEFNAMDEAGNAFGSSLSAALSDIASGTFNLKDALSSLLSDLTSLFSNQALSLLGGSSAGGGILGKLFGSFGGLYAGGGTLGAGKWGIAGENGPEPIVGPATVIPNRGMGGNVVQIIDQRRNAPAVEQRRGANGISQFIIRDAVNEVIGSGQADSALRARHGITPQKARR